MRRYLSFYYILRSNARKPKPERKKVFFLFPPQGENFLFPLFFPLFPQSPFFGNWFCLKITNCNFSMENTSFSPFPHTFPPRIWKKEVFPHLFGGKINAVAMGFSGTGGKTSHRVKKWSLTQDMVSRKKDALFRTSFYFRRERSFPNAFSQRYTAVSSFSRNKSTEK